jgi:hypothetical protein
MNIDIELLFLFFIFTFFANKSHPISKVTNVDSHINKVEKSKKRKKKDFFFFWQGPEFQVPPFYFFFFLVNSP